MGKAADLVRQIGRLASQKSRAKTELRHVLRELTSRYLRLSDEERGVLELKCRTYQAKIASIDAQLGPLRAALEEL